MTSFRVAALTVAVCVAGLAHAAPPSNAELTKQVADTERAFAATMKARDLAAFSSFLSDETVFYNGKEFIRGKETVTQAWTKFYEKPQAPFSWEPDQVQVLDSGTLASSSGPVYDATGKRISRFHSIWRLEKDGKWKIVFDRGESQCDCAK